MRRLPDVVSGPRAGVPVLREATGESGEACEETGGDMTDRKTIWLPSRSVLEVDASGHWVEMTDRMEFEQKPIREDALGFAGLGGAAVDEHDEALRRLADA